MQRFARAVAAGILVSAAAPAAPALAETCDTLAYGYSGSADGCQAFCKPDNPAYPNLIQKVKDDKFTQKNVAPGKFGWKHTTRLPFLVSSCQVKATPAGPRFGGYNCTVTICGFLQTATPRTTRQQTVDRNRADTPVPRVGPPQPGSLGSDTTTTPTTAGGATQGRASTAGTPAKLTAPGPNVPAAVGTQISPVGVPSSGAVRPTLPPNLR
jgi:hypothetical protein